jgi:hypothetical protein
MLARYELSARSHHYSQSTITIVKISAGKCWEEQPDRKIKEMEEKLRIDEKIIMEYIQKFGRIKPH